MSSRLLQFLRDQPTSGGVAWLASFLWQTPSQPLLFLPLPVQDGLQAAFSQHQARRVVDTFPH